jgi:hypothetical protein
VTFVAQSREQRQIDPTLGGNHARGIIDLSRCKLIDRPAFVEEKLLKTRGIVSVEVNVFSNRLFVEFDPSVITLEKIRSMIKADG